MIQGDTIVVVDGSSSTSPSHSSGPAVLYIGGFGRSGSTLVERVVAADPQVASLGEVVHLWKRGIVWNDLCGCGVQFSSCPFWSAVGAKAFGGWESIDLDEISALHDALDRQRHVWRTMRPSRGTREALLRYTSYYDAVYRAAAEISDADIVVDSSKHASLAVALSNDPDIDLRVLHLVRDSVAVAHSWSKAVRYATTDEGHRDMPRFSTARASALWMSNNALVPLARLVGSPTYRMRYEDFVRSPTRSIQTMWRAVNLPGSYDLDLSQPGGVDLEPGHSIGGNPMRFATGPLVIRADEGWRENMPANQRRIVKTLTFPLRAGFGYVGRRS